MLGVGSASAAGAPAAADWLWVPYTDPVWSPDAKRVAFVKQRRLANGGFYGSLHVMNSDGSSARRLTREEQGMGWPSWSPDSKRLAFVFYPRVAATGPTIHVIGVDGRGLRKLGFGSYPDWSPGGRKIAYNSGILDSDVGDILVMNPDGTQSTVVAESRGDGTAYVQPTWSPRGERLRFVLAAAPDTANDVEPYLLYIDDYFNGRVRILSRVGVFEPDWGPDGRRVAYTAFEGSGNETRPTVRVLDLRTQRTWFLHDGTHARWSPDGRQLVFVNGGHIYAINADGSNLRQLTR